MQRLPPSVDRLSSCIQNKDRFESLATILPNDERARRLSNNNEPPCAQLLNSSRIPRVRDHGACPALASSNKAHGIELVWKATLPSTGMHNQAIHAR